MTPSYFMNTFSVIIHLIKSNITNKRTPVKSILHSASPVAGYIYTVVDLKVLYGYFWLKVICCAYYPQEVSP